MRKGSLSCGSFAATVPLPFAGQVGLNTSINVTPRGWSELLAACLLSLLLSLPDVEHQPVSHYATNNQRPL